MQHLSVLWKCQKISSSWMRGRRGSIWKRSAFSINCILWKIVENMFSLFKKFFCVKLWSANACAKSFSWPWQFFFFALSLHVFFLLFPIPFSDMAVFKALRSSCLQIAIQICYYRLVHRLYKSKTIAMVPSLPPPMIRCNTTVAHVPVPSETITMRHQRRRQRRRRRRLREMAPATMPALKLATTTTISTTTTTTTIIINSTTISTTTTIPIRIITIVHIHMQTFIAPILFTIIATIRRIWAVCVRQLHLWILNQPRKHIRPNINLMIAYWPPNTMNHRRYHQRLAKIRHRQILV